MFLFIFIIICVCEHIYRERRCKYFSCFFLFLSLREELHFDIREKWSQGFLSGLVRCSFFALLFPRLGLLYWMNGLILFSFFSFSEWWPVLTCLVSCLYRSLPTLSSYFQLVYSFHKHKIDSDASCNTNI